MILFTGYLTLIASALLFYFPGFALPRKKQNIGGDQLARVKRKYNIGMSVTFTFIALAMVYIVMQENRFGEKSFLLLVPFVSAISMFDGAFALITGFYPLHVIERIVIHWYGADERKNAVAKWQIGLALTLSTAGMLLYLN